MRPRNFNYFLLRALFWLALIGAVLIGGWTAFAQDATPLDEETLEDTGRITPMPEDGAMPTIQEPEPPVPVKEDGGYVDETAPPLPVDPDTTPDNPSAYEGGLYSSAVLQGLNKVTARVSQFTVQANHPSQLGNLEIRLLNCWRSSPEEAPESAALLEITEKRPDEQNKRVFLGWMFASSPALSALEHPVYDITVLSCKN